MNPYARLVAGLLPLVATLALCAYGCGVSAAQHTANGLEAAQATVEYDDCRVKARDGGTWESFCACVRGVDAKHHVDGGPCE